MFGVVVERSFWEVSVRVRTGHSAYVSVAIIGVHLRRGTSRIAALCRPGRRGLSH